MSKNKVPSIPTPAIDAAKEKYLRLLAAAGYSEEALSDIQLGIDPWIIPTINAPKYIFATAVIPEFTQ